jgi:hypothetical protein
MAKEKERLITVTANDQNRTIKLENPNLKIISKQGDQISIHSFFDLFSTIDRTKKIKKQLDKEVSMLKTIQLSFQKKLNKFKSAKLFSIRKIKNQENYLMRHYEEIVAKMKAKAHEEISAQFSEFKQEIAEEKNKLVNEIATENKIITKTIQSAEENLSAQFSKLENVIEKTKSDAIETLASIQEETIIEISSKSDEISEQLATLKKEIAEEKETINYEYAKTEKLIKETKAITIETIETLQNETIINITSKNEEINNKLFEFKQEIVEGKKELSSQLFELEKTIEQSQSETTETISALQKNTILEIDSRTSASLTTLTNENNKFTTDLKTIEENIISQYSSSEKILSSLHKEATATFLGFKKSITEDKNELLKEIDLKTEDSFKALTSESNKFSENLEAMEQNLISQHSSFEQILEKAQTGAVETIMSLQEDTILEIKANSTKILEKLSGFEQNLDGEKEQIIKEIDSRTSYSLNSINTESINLSNSLKTMEENILSLHSKFEKSLEESKEKTSLDLTAKKDDIASTYLGFKKIIIDEKDNFIKEIDSKTSASLTTINNETTKFSGNLKTIEQNLVAKQSAFEKTISSLAKETSADVDAKNILITEKILSINTTAEELKAKILLEIDEAKNKALLELDDTGTTRENFKKFTKISQDYIQDSIKSAIAEVETVKASLSSEISALSAIANKEILDIRKSAKEQSLELKTDLNLLKETIQEEITKLQATTADELTFISKQTKQESSENLKTVLANIEEFSNKTKAEIAELTKKFDADQDNMLNNTYKDLQLLQIKLKEIDKTEDMQAINEEFKKLKNQNELTLEDIKTSTNQAITKSIEELFNKMKAINSSNQQELQLAKEQISENEQMFYDQIRQKVDEILKTSKTEQAQQLQITSDKVTALKQETQHEVQLIKKELHEEKLQMIETATDDLNKLKDEINKKAEKQIDEATGLLQGFKLSFEKSQKELLAQNKEQFQKLEQEATFSLQEKISSVKTYIEEIKNDSIRNIHEITKDVENEQKALNKLIVQVKGIKTTLETGIFADLDSTIKNIESIKQSHTMEMDSLKKENQKTQQESIRQLKIMVENTINSQLQQALDKITILQEQLRTEKNQLSESSINLGKIQSQTQQEIYEQLEQTLTNVNTIKEEAESSIKQLKSESFTEILSVKKSLNQIISYLKKQKAQSEKKLLSPTVITKRESQDQNELISMLLKEGLNL